MRTHLHSVTSEDVERSLARVREWVERHDYRGFEPFDGLSSWVRPLLCSNLFAERLLQQLIRQSPINLRLMLGVSPQESTKGRGYMAGGYLLLHQVTEDQSCLDKAVLCLEWLDKN